MEILSYSSMYPDALTSSAWYAELIRPEWAPPAWLFGPVWSVLYLIIIISFGTVLYRAIRGQLAGRVALPFVLNIIANLAFTPIQFGLRSNLLAAVDILLVLGTLIWALFALWRAAPELRWVVFANIPYLAWVVFATVLQLSITWLNA